MPQNALEIIASCGRSEVCHEEVPFTFESAGRWAWQIPKDEVEL